MADDLNISVSDSVNVQDSADVQRTWLDLQTGVLHIGQQQIDLADYVSPDKLDQLLADVRHKSFTSAIGRCMNMRDRRARSILTRRVTVALALNQMLQTTDPWQNEREFYEQLCLTEQYTKTTVKDSFTYKTFKRDIQVIEDCAAYLIHDPFWFEFRIRKVE